MGMTPEMISSLSSAKMELISAKARSSGVNIAKERMKNLLFNYYEDLIQAALENVSLKEEVSSLEIGLDESDNENKKLRQEIQGLQTRMGNDTVPKKSTKKE